MRGASTAAVDELALAVFWPELASDAITADEEAAGAVVEVEAVDGEVVVVAFPLRMGEVGIPVAAAYAAARVGDMGSPALGTFLTGGLLICGALLRL